MLHYLKHLQIALNLSIGFTWELHSFRVSQINGRTTLHLRQHSDCTCTHEPHNTRHFARKKYTRKDRQDKIYMHLLSFSHWTCVSLCRAESKYSVRDLRVRDLQNAFFIIFSRFSSSLIVERRWLVAWVSQGVQGARCRRSDAVTSSSLVKSRADHRNARPRSQLQLVTRLLRRHNFTERTAVWQEYISIVAPLQTLCPANIGLIYLFSRCNAFKLRLTGYIPVYMYSCDS